MPLVSSSASSAIRNTISTLRIVPTTATYKYNSWSYNDGGTSQFNFGGVAFDNNRANSYLFIAVVMTTSTGGQANPPASLLVLFPLIYGGQVTVTATRVNQTTGRGSTYTKGLFMYMVQVPANCYSTAVVTINAPASTNYYSGYIMVHQVQGWYNSSAGMTASVDSTVFTSASSTATASKTISTLVHPVTANRINLILGFCMKQYTDAEMNTISFPVKNSASADITTIMQGVWNQPSNGYGYILYSAVVEGGATDSTHSVAIEFPTQSIPVTLHLGATVKI